MARRPAGAKYPHVTTDARPHDHRWCPVVLAIARVAQAGKEQWGVRHEFPPVPDEMTAKSIRSGFYRARYCRDRDGLPALSLRADYDVLSDGTFRPWVQVWTRAQAKAEIVRRVQSGEPLAYNVRRRQP